MDETKTSDLWIERLMARMKVLCKDIGPRPPTSEQERQAARYVKNALEQLGCKDIQGDLGVCCV